MVVFEELVVRFYMFRGKSKNSRGNFGLKMASENIGFLFCQKKFFEGEGDISHSLTQLLVQASVCYCH